MPLNFITRYEEYMGPMPPLFPAPAETDTQEPEVAHHHMSIRSLLEVRLETNAVCTLFVIVMNHIYAFK